MKPILSLSFVFVCFTLAWFVLSGSISWRTNNTGATLHRRVQRLWGAPLQQQAPVATIHKPGVNRVWNSRSRKWERREIVQQIEQPLCGTDLRVHLKLDLRRKGLLWYSTYAAKFHGEFCIQNDTAETQTLHIAMALPSRGGVFDDVDVVDTPSSASRPGRVLPSPGGSRRKFSISSNNEIRFQRVLPPGKKRWVTITYQSRGMDQWTYSFGMGNKRVENFRLRLFTDFQNLDFPEQSLSPQDRKRHNSGSLLTWEFKRLITGASVGVRTPQPLDPGKFASRVSFSAPVGLFLFFFALWLLTNLKQTPLHTMHYFFVACACFSFHLLMAYTADRLTLESSFVLSAVTSLVLVVTYLRFPLGWKTATLVGGLAHLLYIVLFSAAFFLDGFTGLAITLLCILTLFGVMQLTGNLDWSRLLAQKHGSFAANKRE